MYNPFLTEYHDEGVKFVIRYLRSLGIKKFKIHDSTKSILYGDLEYAAKDDKWKTVYIRRGGKFSSRFLEFGEKNRTVFVLNHSMLRYHSFIIPLKKIIPIYLKKKELGKERRLSSGYLGVKITRKDLDGKYETFTKWAKKNK